MDCIATLQFPDDLACEYDLRARDRLLTVNRYSSGELLAHYLKHGRLPYQLFSNFQPVITDLLTEDIHRSRQRKIRIGKD